MFAFYYSIAGPDVYSVSIHFSDSSPWVAENSKMSYTISAFMEISQRNEEIMHIFPPFLT